MPTNQSPSLALGPGQRALLGFVESVFSAKLPDAALAQSPEEYLTARTLQDLWGILGPKARESVSKIPDSEARRRVVSLATTAAHSVGCLVVDGTTGEILADPGGEGGLFSLLAGV
jgi:hypothetical protein